MQANGGIADAETVREDAVTTVLSGPAAGVVGASAFEPPMLTAWSPSTWAAPPVTSRWSATAGSSGRRRDRSAATPFGSRWSPSRQSGQAEAPSPGSIRAVPSRVGPQSTGADPGPACRGDGRDRTDGHRRGARAGLPGRRHHARRGPGTRCRRCRLRPRRLGDGGRSRRSPSRRPAASSASPARRWPARSAG